MSLDVLNGYTPADFGLDPTEYPEFRRDPLNNREVQLEAIEFGAYCDKWIAAGRIPTGVGKMLIAWCVAHVTGLKTCVLTATKGLQDQYGNELAKVGAVDIRGRTNYTCAVFNNLDCNSGKSMGCRFVGGNGCNYECARDTARQASFVVTNYKYWMTARGAIGDFDLLILDEAHSAVGQVSDFLGFRLTEEDIRDYCDPKIMGDNFKHWQEVAQAAMLDLKAEIVGLTEDLMNMGPRAERQHVRVLHKLEERYSKFVKVGGMDGEDWVLEAQIGTRIGRQWLFDIVWPGQYARQVLFAGVDKVLMMSATLNTKDLSLLGMTRDDYEFREWRRIFPISNCPVYYCPAMTINNEGKDVAIRVVRNTSEEHKRTWVEHMDQMIESRLDRRIVLITSSYDYQEYLMEYSRFSLIMIGNKADPESGTAMDKFQQFIDTPPPTILCSPSFGTGWNFSFERCEFLILTKVPLRVPGGASKVMAARLARDPEYSDNETMRDVVQAIGRPHRDFKDFGEVVIADGSWGWFGYKNSHLAPTGFVKDIRPVTVLPKAPKTIRERNKNGSNNA